jgi:hypothetical protein
MPQPTNAEVNFNEIIPEVSDADLAASWLSANSTDNVPYVNLEPDPATAPTDADIQSLIDAYGN